MRDDAGFKWIPGAAGRFAVIMLLGLSPWPDLSKLFSQLYLGLGNLTLQHLSVGHDARWGSGKAGVLKAERPGRDGPSWDTLLVLTAERAADFDHVYLNPKRQAYLPLLIFLAVIIAAPVRARAKWMCLAVGVPVMLAFAMTSLWITTLWLFARVPALVGDWSQAQLVAVDLAYRALVVPMSNRFILPLFVASLLILWQLSIKDTRLPRAARGGGGAR